MIQTVPSFSFKPNCSKGKSKKPLIRKNQRESIREFLASENQDHPLISLALTISESLGPQPFSTKEKLRDLERMVRSNPREKEGMVTEENENTREKKPKTILDFFAKGPSIIGEKGIEKKQDKEIKGKVKRPFGEVGRDGENKGGVKGVQKIRVYGSKSQKKIIQFVKEF